MGLEYLFVVSFAAQLVEHVRTNCEAAKRVWEYLRMLPEWLIFLEQLDRKKESLRRNTESLAGLADDIAEQLKNEEPRSGKKRRREVNAWLVNAKRVKTEAEEALETRRSTFWSESRIDAILREVSELREKGSFENGLFLDVPLTGKEALITRELVGGHSRYVDTIMEWLEDPVTKRVGVYGVKGVGKTAVLTHVQSRLSKSENCAFDCVYWVSEPREKKPSVAELQEAIARRVGFSDLSEETESMIRAAKLHGILKRRGKCVVILDGFEKVPIEEVGIQECVVVMSASSPRECRKSGCDRILEIERLSDREARDLFMQKLRCGEESVEGFEAEVEEIVEHVVRECKGLPEEIITLGERLIGVDDINEWRDVFNEVTDRLL